MTEDTQSIPGDRENEIALVLRAKNNDEEALDYLYKKYTPCFHLFKKSFVQPGLAPEEALNEIRLHFVFAIKSYDAEKHGNTNFFTYLYKILINKKSTSLKSVNSLKRKDAWNPAMSLSDTEINPGLSDRIEDKHSVLLFDLINSQTSISTLTRREILVICMIGNGYNVPDIATELGATRSRILQIKSNAVKKLSKIAQ